VLCVDQSTPPGQAAAGVAAWPAADLERRLVTALDFAAAAVSDFGETGYVDAVRPALGFGPEKVVAEAAMLAYAAYGASTSTVVRDRIDALARLLAPLVRSPRALADMALNPDQVFRRVVPHVLLTRMGHPDDTFDDLASDLCARVLSHAVDQPATVLEERRWITSLWGRPLPFVPSATGTVLSRPFDLLVGSREDPYGLTHLLFYVTDFGRNLVPSVGRPRAALLADLDALVIRYLDHGDYDLVGELLMAWPQLRAEWSPVAAFAFGVLAHVEDEIGLLPCGNVDPERLASLTGAERTRYARAASYHTALVMGFLCAVALRGDHAPPTRVAGPQHADDAWPTFRAALNDHPGDWRTVFDSRSEVEKRTLAPMLAGLVITQALRQQDFAGLHDAIGAARRFGLPLQPLEGAAAELLQILASAMAVGSGETMQRRSTASSGIFA
jgi:hypothetical protein